MKQLIVYTFAIFFMANTLITSVLAEPCLHVYDEQNIESAGSMPTAMPCHEQAQDTSIKTEQTDTCEEICACVHASVQQTLIKHSDKIIPIQRSRDFLITYSESMKSISILPPLRPPKHYS